MDFCWGCRELPTSLKSERRRRRRKKNRRRRRRDLIVVLIIDSENVHTNPVHQRRQTMFARAHRREEVAGQNGDL